MTRKLLVVEITDEDARGLHANEWGWIKDEGKSGVYESFVRSTEGANFAVPCRVHELPSAEELGRVALEASGVHFAKYGLTMSHACEGARLQMTNRPVAARRGVREGAGERKRSTMDDHKYSGPGSKHFWKRVGKLKDAADHQELYSLGVALQNLETQVLRLLSDAEKRKDVEFKR